MSDTRTPAKATTAALLACGHAAGALFVVGGVGMVASGVRIVIAGHAFVQNVRRGHYELAVEEPAIRRLAVAFGELAVAI